MSLQSGISIDRYGLCLVSSEERVERSDLAEWISIDRYGRTVRASLIMREYSSYSQVFSQTPSAPSSLVPLTYGDILS